MFLKKSLLFTTILALLMFVGQVSAQMSVSLGLGEGGTDKVAGEGTEIVVTISQMGVTAPVGGVQIDFDFDSSLLSLTAGPPGFLLNQPPGSIALLSITPVMLPESASVTFTTNADVTGKAFTIGIKAIALTVAGNQIPVPPPDALVFNAVTASLTSDGEINEDGEISVNLAVPDLAGNTAGAEVMFAVVPAGAAELTDVTPATGVSVFAMDASSATLASPPMMLEGGNFGSLTFTVGADALADKSDFSIGIASFRVLVNGEWASVSPGDPLMVSQYAPFLEADATEVTVGHGETAMATVTAMDTEGEEVTFTVDPADAGTVSDDGNSVTLSATGNATVTVSAMAGGVATNRLRLFLQRHRQNYRLRAPMWCLMILAPWLPCRLRLLVLMKVLRLTLVMKLLPIFRLWKMVPA